MSRQDKAITERHAKTLRELLKRPDNKFCADCKRNDPRWASWNLGVFLCIRCSGIHRSMGTHISRVKSVDLDVWTPEQMASIQKWGNRLANLYWEAHLRAGHVPPDHKMDSFIRSKYESRRWAREGPPPEDPSSLDTEGGGSASPAPQQSQSPAQTHQSRSSVSSLASVSRSAVTSRQPQPHQLLSTGVANRFQQSASQSPAPTPTPAPAPAQAQTSSAVNDLFSLDFHPPTSPPAASPAASAAAPQKDIKQDILSLYSMAAAQVPAQPAVSGGFGQPTAAVTGMAGSAGVGMWGVSSGWNAAPVVAAAQTNVWGASSQGVSAVSAQQSLFTTSDVWGSSGTTATTAATANGGAGGDLFGSFASSPGVQKKDDAFDDIWGGFK